MITFLLPVTTSAPDGSIPEKEKTQWLDNECPGSGVDNSRYRMSERQLARYYAAFDKLIKDDSNVMTNNEVRCTTRATIAMSANDA